MMDYRQLGRTGLTVSAIGCGTWELGGREWGEIGTGDALAVLRHAYDQGVTFFDTADQYGGGRSEQLLGTAFGGQSDVVIATKVGYPLESDGWFVRRGSPPQFNSSRAYIATAVEGSLRRLRREAIDLYQLHQAPPQEQWDEAFATLEDLKRAGKIRHYGVSVSVETGLRVLRETGAECLMFVYNLLTPEPEDELLPLAERNGVGVIARTPLASGFLTGKVTAATQFGPGDYRGLWPRERHEHEAARAAAFAFLATDARTPSQAALRFCLAHPAVSAVVPGMMSVDQAADGVAALAAPPLSAAELERVRDIRATWE